MISSTDITDIKSKFLQLQKVKGLLVPTHLIKNFLSNFKENLLARPHKPSIVKDFLENDCKLVLLSKILYDIPEKEWPSNLLDFISKHSLKILDYEIKEDYDDYNMTDALSKLLPKGITIPSGFEIIGTIAHLNLKKDQLPYKFLIGQVLLDKNHLIKTVANKTEALSNVFRTPEIEIIAGEKSLITELKEGKCLFRLAYDKVYWNSKLQHERDRILKLFKPKERFLDLFCGIGPLSIRAAKQGLTVFANDLNPDCYEYLKINAKINKVIVKCFNMDARDCFRDIVSAKKTEINKDLKSEEKFFDHIYMNLPGDAIEFLDIFYGFLKFADLNSWNKDNLPLIHVYSFCESDEEKSNNILMERIRKKLPNFKNENVTCFHTIKDVSTFKKMFGISFKLSVEDALGLGVENSNDLGENPSKKIKI